MNAVNLILPTKWEDLSDKQLRYVFALLAQGFTATEVKAYCLHRWAGLKVLHRYGNVWACKHDGLQFILAAEQVERATHALDWLDSVPTLPVRLAKIGSHRAIDAQFQGVPFETFIVCDNLYQGYLATKQDELLDEMASHLYTRKCSDEGVVCSNLLRGLFPPYTLHLMLGVIDTGALLASPKAIAMRADGRFFEVSLSQAFLEYGLWQDYGTGRETPRKSSAERELAHTSAEAQPGSRLRHPRGNSGDIGRTKVRQRRKWFSRKYYASVMNIKEFYEDNIGRSFTGIISNALNKNFGR